MIDVEEIDCITIYEANICLMMMMVVVWELMMNEESRKKKVS